MNRPVALNLGCGKTRIPGSIGVDRHPLPACVDLVCDLDVTPYPFRECVADEVHLYHVLEHQRTPVAVLEEIWRLLKPGGVLHLRVPHFSSLGAFTDLTHVRPFGYGSFDCLEAAHPQHYYTRARFRILAKEIKYFGLYPNTGIYAEHVHPNQCVWFARPIVRWVNWCIRRSPILFERLWCYWVGGAMELVVTLQKESDPEGLCTR